LIRGENLIGLSRLPKTVSGCYTVFFLSNVSALVARHAAFGLTKVALLVQQGRMLLGQIKFELTKTANCTPTAC
jgi:hypothetical protein